MTNRRLNAFLDRLGDDDKLFQRAKEALQGQEDTAAAAVEFAAALGYDFTRDEFEAALGERYADRELTDEQLEMVAGGLFSAVTLSGGLCIAFPDVCKTPSPGGPVPVPYPNIGMATDTKSTSTKGTKG